MFDASWKTRLAGRVPDAQAREIDAYEANLAAKRAGRIEDPVFAEQRLRQGAYGQRYDNGRRHDGVTTQTLAFPDASTSKGPGTLWDAPGMQRIKIPFGGLNTEEIAEVEKLSTRTVEREWRKAKAWLYDAIQE